MPGLSKALTQISRSSRAVIPRQEYDADASFAAALIVGFLDNPVRGRRFTGTMAVLEQSGFQVPHDETAL